MPASSNATAKAWRWKLPLAQLEKQPAFQSCANGAPSEAQNSGGSSAEGSSTKPLRPQALGSSTVKRSASALTVPARVAATIVSRASSAPIRQARIRRASAAGSQDASSLS